MLDVGCNGGTVAVHMLAKGAHVKGVDIVPELVRAAKKRGVFAEVGEAEDLSRFKDNSFDKVVCAEVLEYLYDPKPAIQEAYRVLKPGGKYLVTVLHPASVMVEKSVGDYHQQNFSLEVLDTLFHMDFERKKVRFSEIPYIPEYCQANGIDPNRPQWLALEAIK